MISKIPTFFYSIFLGIFILLIINLGLMIFTDPISTNNRAYFIINISLIFLILIPLIKTWAFSKFKLKITPNEFYKRKFVGNIKDTLIFSALISLKIFQLINLLTLVIFLVAQSIVIVYREWRYYHRHRRFF